MSSLTYRVVQMDQRFHVIGIDAERPEWWHEIASFHAKVRADDYAVQENLARSDAKPEVGPPAVSRAEPQPAKPPKAVAPPKPPTQKPPELVKAIVAGASTREVFEMTGARVAAPSRTYKGGKSQATLLLQLLTARAERGGKTPTAAEMLVAIGKPATAPRVAADSVLWQLKNRKLIRVHGFAEAKVIEIVATGKRTVSAAPPVVEGEDDDDAAAEDSIIDHEEVQGTDEEIHTAERPAAPEPEIRAEEAAIAPMTALPSAQSLYESEPPILGPMRAEAWLVGHGHAVQREGHGWTVDGKAFAGENEFVSFAVAKQRAALMGAIHQAE